MVDTRSNGLTSVRARTTTHAVRPVLPQVALAAIRDGCDVSTREPIRFKSYDRVVIKTTISIRQRVQAYSIDAIRIHTHVSASKTIGT
eukprot:COSAG02_NODE_44799_length_363_cov_0.530303_1_plen_87_part_01